MKLAFVPNSGDEGEGFGEPGIETFRDSPYSALARETGQNSRDARSGTGTVRLEVEQQYVPTSELPDIEEYRRVVALCRKVAEANCDAKEIEFFARAQDVLNSDTISVITLSDYNTTGLLGPCEQGKPFHALVKSMGISSKGDANSGGSFGIGKSAAFAASDLQTVFYSTIYRDEEGKKFLCQGKTRFRTFEDGSRSFRSVGYVGKPERFLPVEEVSGVPGWLGRSEVGTTVCILAARNTQSWQDEFIASVCTNFFSAIHNRDMEFVVQGKRIDAENLHHWLFSNKIEAAADNAGEKEQLLFSRYLYQCLTDEQTVTRDISVEGLGVFRAMVLVKEGLPKQVGILRNGMYITSSMEKFGDSFKVFPMCKSFVALVEPAGVDEGVWMKNLENPRHDSLSPDRIVDPSKADKAKKKGRKLAQRVRELIKDCARSPSNSTTELDELSQFFAGEEDVREDRIGRAVPDRFRVAPKENRRRQRTTGGASDQSPDGEQGGSRHGEGNGSGADGFGAGRGSGSGAGGRGGMATRKPFPLIGPRVIMEDPAAPERRTITFTPGRSGVAELQLFASGMSEPEALGVEGELRVECMDGVRIRLEVMLHQPYAGPLEIRSMEVGSEG